MAAIWLNMSLMTGQDLLTSPSNYHISATEKVHRDPPVFIQVLRLLEIELMMVLSSLILSQIFQIIKGRYFCTDLCPIQV